RSSGLLRLGFLCLDRSGSFGLRSLRLGGGRLLRRSLRITDRNDAQQGHLLTVPSLATVVVPPALLEDGDLLALRLGDDLGRNGDLAGFGELLAIAGQQDIAQRDRVAGVARQ